MFALSTGYIHWSFNQYALYTIAGVAIALVHFNHKQPLSVASGMFFAIVCLSSAYAGLFKRTGLLLGIQRKVNKLSQKTNSYIIILIISILTGIIACNQTLIIMLTKQLTLNLQEDKKYALYLEDSAVVISPLIPWSIAGAVPLASVNALTLSIVFVFFEALPCGKIVILVFIVAIFFSFVTMAQSLVTSMAAISMKGGLC